MSGLKLFLLGPPRIELNDAPVHVSRRKALALLAYLAVTGEPQRRETVMTLLWPDSDRALAQSYLRRDLAILNKSLGEGWLDADRDSVALTRRDDFWLDVAQFRRLLAAGAAHGHPVDEVCPQCLPCLSTATDLYRDGFLTGFTLADSPQFDEWQFFESEALRRELAGALAKLVEGYVAEAALETAIPPARRWLALEPWHEPALRQLMQLYAWTGNEAAALRQYTECVRVLEEELGQSPEPATRELYEAIRTRRIPTPPVPTRRTDPVGDAGAGPVGPRHNLPPEPGPFVGRDGELADIGRLLLDEPACRMLTLVGPGGIGKSRLALRAARQAIAAFPNGIFLIPLASVGSPELLTSTIAEAIGLNFQGRTDPQAQLLDYLREKTILLGPYANWGKLGL